MREVRRVEVSGVRQVFDGFFAVDEATVSYERLDGSMSPEATRLSVERGDSVAILIYDRSKDSVLFVRQFRYPILRHSQPWLLEIVAGKIDKGETAEEAVRRESLEEVGCQLPRLKEIASFFPSPGGLSEMITVFYAEIEAKDRVSAPGGLVGEDLELVELSKHEAVELLQTGRVMDGKTLVALQWLALRHDC